MGVVPFRMSISLMWGWPGVGGLKWKTGIGGPETFPVTNSHPARKRRTVLGYGEGYVQGADNSLMQCRFGFISHHLHMRSWNSYRCRFCSLTIKKKKKATAQMRRGKKLTFLWPAVLITYSNETPFFPLTVSRDQQPPPLKLDFHDIFWWLRRATWQAEHC